MDDDLELALAEALDAVKGRDVHVTDAAKRLIHDLIASIGVDPPPPYADRLPNRSELPLRLPIECQRFAISILPRLIQHGVHWRKRSTLGIYDVIEFGPELISSYFLFKDPDK